MPNRSGVVVPSCTCALVLLAGVGFASPTVAASLSSPQGTSAFDRGDYVVAARELGPAARHGNARAQAMLGFMYEHGFGVPQDYHIAVAWYIQAAEQGDAIGQYSLGLLYDKGFGVKQNDVHAYKWLNLAAAAAAAPLQREYYLRIRDAVASKMSQSSVVESQALAREWTRKREPQP
jgi:uncharacterized protein